MLNYTMRCRHYDHGWYHYGYDFHDYYDYYDNYDYSYYYYASTTKHTTSTM